MRYTTGPTPRMLPLLLILVGSFISNLGCNLQPGTLGPGGLVQNWLVLQPIPISPGDGKAPEDALQREAFARDWLAAEGGEAALQGRAGGSLTIAGHALTWQRVTSKRGIIDLQVAGHPTEYALAYACAEIDRPERGKVFLGIGSDDAVKVWLNGKLVHENWICRGLRLDDDLVPVELESGKNRLLLKVQNGSGPWGLGCRVMSEDEGLVIQAINHEVQAIVEGDSSEFIACCHTVTENDSRRLKSSAAIYAAVARLRRAFDETYGPGALSQVGFRHVPPGTKLPPQPGFKWDGLRATVTAPGWSPLTVVRMGDRWKQLIEEEANPAGSTASPLPIETELASLLRLSEIIDGAAAEVRAGQYLSAADAFGVINAKLHGQAGTSQPTFLATRVDFTAPTTRLAVCPVPIIDLRGDAVAIGKAHGTQLADPIRTLDREYLNRFLNEFHTLFGRGFTRQLLLAQADKFKPFIRPEHFQEIQATADGAGMDRREALLAQCFMDMMAETGCSTIALPASASSDGIARFGRNLDYMALNLLDRHSILIIIHPQDRYAFAAVSWPGLVGVLSGMNEHGLSLGCMEVARSFRKPDAMPFTLLYRCVLERCKTVDEAIAFLEKTPRQTAHTLMLMDASGDRAVTEITPEKVTVRRASDTTALVSTNHHRGVDLDTPGRCQRFDYLHDAGRRLFGHFSEAAVEELLTGVSQADATLQSIVFEPANRVIYLAVGAGAPNHGFYRIDLKSYFR